MADVSETFFDLLLFGGRERDEEPEAQKRGILFGNRGGGGFPLRGGGEVHTRAGKASREEGGGVGSFFRCRNVRQADDLRNLAGAGFSRFALKVFGILHTSTEAEMSME